MSGETVLPQKKVRKNQYGTVIGEAVLQKETDKLVYNFNASIPLIKFYRQDIRGSKAHVAMLGKTGF